MQASSATWTLESCNLQGVRMLYTHHARQRGRTERLLSFVDEAGLVRRQNTQPAMAASVASRTAAPTAIAAMLSLVKDTPSCFVGIAGGIPLSVLSAAL
jgi:hypothetical protein